MPISSRQGLVYATTEGTPGTGETITQGGQDAIRVLSVEFSQVGQGLIRRDDLIGPYPGGLALVKGGLLGQMVITCELTPFDDITAATGHAQSPLLRACGVLSSNGSDTATWRPAATLAYATGPEPCTVEFHEIGGNRYRLTGAVGTLNVSAETGQRPQVTYTLTGMWADPAASAFNASSATYANDELPYISEDGTLTTGLATGASAVEGLASWTYTPGVTVTPRPDAASSASDAYAIAFYDRGSYDELAMTVDADDESTVSWWGDALGTEANNVSIMINSGGTQTCEIDLESAYYDLPQPSTGQPYRQYDIVALATVQSDGDTSSIVWNEP